jgi:hypothetical protein
MKPKMKIPQKPIEIWWGVNTSDVSFAEGIRAEEPVPVFKKFLKDYAGKDEATKVLARCPAIADELHNVYGVKPYYDYTLRVDSDGVLSTMDYDQKFYDAHINVRSNKFISFAGEQVFFAPYEKSLLMTQTAPSLEDNDIANKTFMIPGRFDIAKYFRSVDFAFLFKKETSTITFLREDIYFYIRFHTTRPIVFRQFFWDKELNEFNRPMMAVKNNKYWDNPKANILSYYYKLFDKFQFKKKIIKIIEQNLTKK